MAGKEIQIRTLVEADWPMNGVWRDTILLERRSDTAGID